MPALALGARKADRFGEMVGRSVSVSGLGERGRISLFAPAAAGFVALGAALALWPILFRNGVLWFPDSQVYLLSGERLWRSLFAAVGIGAEVPGAAPVEASLRSVAYAAFVGLPASLGLPAVAATYMQACLVLALVWPLVAQAVGAAPRLAAVAAATMLVATPLPFFAAFLMPDVFGACVILYGILLVRGWDRLTVPTRVATTAIAVFAVATHYGNLPLAAAVLAVAIAVQWWRGRLGLQPILIGVGALALAAAVNVAIGVVAFDRPSLAPKRLPILLARSIDDGPARWYLEESCGTEGYAVCSYWDGDIPGNVGAALWGERGLGHAPPEVLERVRAEEPAILWHAFLAYPLRQMGSLFGNTARQLVTVGTADFELTEMAPDAPRMVLLRGMGAVHLASYLGGIAALAVLVWRSPRAGGAVLVLAVGLLANAAIFGGLSAPVDRYQARVAWLAPLLAFLILMERPHRTASA